MKDNQYGLDWFALTSDQKIQFRITTEAWFNLGVKRVSNQQKIKPTSRYERSFLSAADCIDLIHRL